MKIRWQPWLALYLGIAVLYYIALWGYTLAAHVTVTTSLVMALAVLLSIGAVRSAWRTAEAQRLLLRGRTGAPPVDGERSAVLGTIALRLIRGEGIDAAVETQSEIRQKLGFAIFLLVVPHLVLFGWLAMREHDLRRVPAGGEREASPVVSGERQSR